MDVIITQKGALVTTVMSLAPPPQASAASTAEAVPTVTGPQASESLPPTASASPIAGAAPVGAASAALPPRTCSRIFAYSRRDAIAAAAGVAHFAYLLGLFLAFPYLSWWALVPLGFVYAVSISWNINGVSHNFLHNPFFRSAALNRAFSLMESVTVGFSQVFYTQVHRDHHTGNSDLPDAAGHTDDPLSIYKRGHDGNPEGLFSYVFLSYFRDEPKAIYQAIKKRDPREAAWGIVEIALFVATWATMFALDWRFMLFLLPCYYLGHCLSYLNGYYLDYGANPNLPIAWGVSAYGRVYNWLWFNNSYHAEHHYRPRCHWTRMKALRDELRAAQAAAAVRVIKPPHALGFLDCDLPRFDEYPSQTPAAATAAAATTAVQRN